MKFLAKCGLIISIHLMAACCYSNTIYSVIPQPVNLQPQEGVFEIQPDTLIVSDKKNIVNIP